MNPQSSLKNAQDTANEFAHGYENGKLALDKQHYESFLTNQVHYNQTLDKTQHRRSELAELEAHMQEARKETGQWVEQLQRHAHRIPLKEHQAEILRNAAEQAAAERERLREQRKATRNDNPFLIGLFYVLAGLLFIVGDLIVSKDIVAYAFGFKGFEAWSFAGGLAALSLLLKPAYERLIEHYYEEGKPKRYIYFKMVLLFFALTTLAVLGLYRYDAYRVDKMKAFLNNEAAYLQSGAGSNSPTLIAKLDSLRRQRLQLNNELLNDPWGAWSFVLTGILFAVSGAVSLGVGTPIVQTYWKRWVQIPIRIRQAKRAERKLTKELAQAETELSEEKTQKAIAESHLAMFNRPEEIKQQMQEIRTELRDLLDQQSAHDVERRVSQYNDGYARGKTDRSSSVAVHNHLEAVNGNGHAKAV